MPRSLPRGRIILVGCSASKLAVAAEARELYTSPLFRKARAWAEREVAAERAIAWGILSAEHGLLGPSEVVEPYDKAISDLDRDYRWAWAGRVDLILRCHWGLWPAPPVILAGRNYAEPLARFDWCEAPELPLDGLQIGQRLCKMSELLKTKEGYQHRLLEGD